MLAQSSLQRRQRLLIVGPGDVAQRLIAALAQRMRVYALVRRAEAAPALRALGARVIVGDLDQPATLKRLVGLAPWVLHSAPPPDAGTDDPRTRRLVAALGRYPPARLVYIGTTGIYGDCGGAQVSEARPLKPTTARAKRRAAAESTLRRFGRRTGCRVSLLRAPGIYAANRLPLARLERGDPVLVAGEDVFTNHIHADDLARSVLAAFGRGRAGRTYNVCDDTRLKMGDFYDQLADAFALPRPPRMTRAEIGTRLSPLTLSFMAESRRLSNTRLTQELRFTLRYPSLEAGIRVARVSLTEEKPR